MKIEDKIIDEKVKYKVNRDGAKPSALKSSKIDKYEFVTGKKKLPSNENRLTEKAKFKYSPLGKAFENKIKTNKSTSRSLIKSGCKKESLTFLKQK